MSYAHDIFISYRRDNETRAWLDNHFLPLLKLRLGQELARTPHIFVDNQLESGVSWPPQLGIELGRSRILVALWAKDYFASMWCTEEMVLMLARERECGLRTDRDPRGLVVPAVIHDGADFPQALSEIQRFEIQDCFNVRMARDSARAEQLDAILSTEARALAGAIDAAPPWRSEWSVTAARHLRETLSAVAPSQDRPPGFAD